MDSPQTPGRSIVGPIVFVTTMLFVAIVVGIQAELTVRQHLLYFVAALVATAVPLGLVKWSQRRHSKRVTKMVQSPDSNG